MPLREEVLKRPLRPGVDILEFDRSAILIACRIIPQPDSQPLKPNGTTRIAGGESRGGNPLEHALRKGW